MKGTSHNNCVKRRRNYIAANGTNPANWQRVYNLTDHGGNVRVELKSPALNNTTDGCTPYSYAMYYPYGMQKTLDIRYWYPSDVSPAHQYNGNEREKVSSGYHDFNYRWYDQQLGRFLEQDPLAEKDYSVSPYAFCGGDPVNYADKLGLTGTKTGSGDGWMTGELDEWEVTPDGARINPSGSGSNMTAPGNSFRAWQAQWERDQAANQSMNKESEYQRMQRLMTQQGIEKGDKSNSVEKVSDLIKKYTDPKVDLTVGAAEYKVGKILTNRAAYGKIVSPVIIKTAVANINVSAKALQATGNILKGAGFGLGVVGVVGTAAQYYSGQISGAEASLDLVMGGVGFIPGCGWAVSGAYFLVAKPLYNYATEP